MLKSNWNHSSFSANGELYGLRAMPASGWRGGYKRTGKQSGYHKQQSLADMKVTAWQVKNGIEPVDTKRLIHVWMRDHGF